MTDDDIAEWDAAYVLGALSQDDRHIYESYLAANPQGAAKLTELAGLPGILNALSRDEAVALTERAGDAPPEGRPLNMMPSLAEAAAKRQRRSRRTTAAVAVAVAAALAILGGVVGARVFPGPAVTVEAAALQPMQPTPRGGVTAALAVTEKKWGTRLDWTCDYTKDWAKNASSYDIVVTTDDGQQTAVGTWSPESDHAAGLAASTAIPTNKIHTVDIRVSGTDEPLAITTMG
jgi:hypothetical protein